MEFRDLEEWHVTEILPYPNIKVPGSMDHHTYRLHRIRDLTEYVVDYCLAPYFTHKDLINEQGIFFSIHKEVRGLPIKVAWTDVVICMKILMERKLKLCTRPQQILTDSQTGWVCMCARSIFRL